LDTNLVKKIKNLTSKYKKFFTHLDSHHTAEHVLKELNIYSKFCSSNNYIVVGDTILANIPNQKHRPREWSKKNNPMFALNSFLKHDKSFKIDKIINYRQIFSNQPSGYLKKK